MKIQYIKNDIRSLKLNLIPKPSFDKNSYDHILNALKLKKDIHLEIGSGAGLHAIQWGKTHSKDSLLIALERTNTRFQKLKNRLKKHPEITNVFAFQTDATNWAPHYLIPECISYIYILYPNPYPLSKNKNLRWVNMPAMHSLLTTLKPKGHLILATNKLDYAEESKIGFQKNWGLLLKEYNSLNSEFKPRTHFEKKYLDRGESCYNLVFEKN